MEFLRALGWRIGRDRSRGLKTSLADRIVAAWWLLRFLGCRIEGLCRLADRDGRFCCQAFWEMFPEAFLEKVRSSVRMISCVCFFACRKPSQFLPVAHCAWLRGTSTNPTHLGFSSAGSLRRESPIFRISSSKRVQSVWAIVGRVWVSPDSFSSKGRGIPCIAEI